MDSSILPGCSVNPCSQCAEVPDLVVDCAVDARWMWCFQCQRRQDFLPQSVTMASTPDPNWFSHGLLASLGSLYGWGSPPVTQPGTRSQSWLFSPLISWGLSAPGVFLRTAQDPESLCVQFYSEHLSSLSPQCDVALALQSNWERGDHLPARVHPCTHHGSPSCVVVCAVRRVLESWFCGSRSNRSRGSFSSCANPLNARTSLPSSARLVDIQVLPSIVSPFSLAVPPVPSQLLLLPVVSNPFVDLHPNVESSHSGPNFSEGGPVRLTRFVEMFLDTYYATVNEMIAAGRFEHIGHPSIRVEGTTAWHSTVLGRHPRLRCGVFYHVANRTLSFHGRARDAVQFLWPLFEDGTYFSLPQLLSV